MTAESPSLTHLRLERPSPGVARLVLDNPGQRNAMSADMTRSWGLAIDALAADRDLRVVVVTGEGSAFCSGGDPRWIAGEPDATVDQLRTRMIGFYRAWLAIRALEVPTIAAVNGPAVGAGLCLALACDLRYAAAGATLSAPFVRLGMNPGMASTYLLPDVVGDAHARELLLTGRSVHAEEARQLGMVSRVFADDAFAAEVQQIAEGIAATAPIASRYTTVSLRGGGHRDLESAIQWEALAQPITLATEDLQEGVRAAREKRPPQFRNA
ncbi:enoyl-CoA hydratase/isomerase family protein [Nocardioides pocheonensis]|uniref:Enoyl-CoA hydratase/isomerase family protein n=1 Tax=Nocardioides pocheonensis TaxID=661485 RepID=A0A3N0GYM4_9ACTN|nr:enoyl-CoA hydratase-related protein [Nocardioides pocheonensis]RNM17573.1 enoyl-CoA hydratase/isomerase family protein [Nocardioides pocheonensis]